MSEEVLDQNANAGDGIRPTFLTVLCILTFIGSGLGIILNLTQQGYDTWYQLFLVILNIGTGYGAYEMWNLKKRGLYIYTAAQSVAIIFPFIYVYVILSGAGLGAATGLASTLLFIMALIPLAFLIMYWANAKHLKD